MNGLNYGFQDHILQAKSQPNRRILNGYCNPFTFCTNVQTRSHDFMQSFRTPTDKYKYFNKGLHVHSLDHAVGTFVVLLFFINPLYAAVFAFIDYIFHWHIDWAKTNITRKYGWTKDGKAFWRLQTFDQIAHYATYAPIVI